MPTISFAYKRKSYIMNVHVIGLRIMYHTGYQQILAQLALMDKKYYKSLFLEFMDLAIINAFIVYDQRRIAKNQDKLSHVKFLKQLHIDLCETALPASGARLGDALRRRSRLHVTPTKTRSRATTRHTPVQNDE